MESIKVHTLGQLKAWYTKKGRLWHVEEGEELHQFKSCEAMVQKFPELLNVEAIANTIERRAITRSPVDVSKDLDLDSNVMSNTTKCYYCSGVGEVIEGIACPNCHGKGEIHVTTKGL